MLSVEAARSAVAPLSRAIAQLAARPREVLVGLVLVHWLAVAVFALTVRHNGILYYQGGDQIGYTTTASLIADGELPPTFVGYGWVLALVPIAWFVDGAYVSFMPWIMLLNVAMLAPLALACIYGIASRIAGRLFGLWASALWVAAPFLSIPFFRDDYHDRYVEQFLPQALGLSGLADYPSMVCLLVAAYLSVRVLDGADWTWAAAAGLAVGVAASVKPANLLFLGGPLLAALVARNLRPALPFAAGMAPPMILLLLWKVRGLGDLPVFAAPETYLAAGAGLGLLGVDVGRYVDYDLDVFRSNMANLREWFWSVRLLQWIPFAGALAVGRRSLPIAGLLAGWFFGFLMTKGTVVQATVESGSFFRLMMPAFPAYFLLFAAIPLLVPGVVRRIREAAPAPPRPLGGRALVALTVVFVAVPLALIVAPKPATLEPSAISVNGIPVPVDERIEVSVTADGKRRMLSWTAPSYGSTKTFYRIFRNKPDGDDLECLGTAAAECKLEMPRLANTRGTSYVDNNAHFDVIYRVGIGTNWRDDPTGGDVILISPPMIAPP